MRIQRKLALYSDQEIAGNADIDRPQARSVRSAEF